MSEETERLLEEMRFRRIFNYQLHTGLSFSEACEKAHEDIMEFIDGLFKESKETK